MKLIISIEKHVRAVGTMFLKASLIKKLVVIFVVLGLIYFGFRTFGSKKQKQQIQTAQVTKGSIISTLTESGNIVAGSEINVVSPTDGFIEEIYVKNGDVVSIGENLFKVKSTATEKEKTAAYASYLSALNSTQTSQQNKESLQAQLETARKTVLDAQNAVDQLNTNIANSYNNPATKQPYTQNEKDSIYSALTTAHQNFTVTETKYKQADTSIGAASSSQSVAWMNYQATLDSVVTAPAPGTIANLSATTGTSVSASNNNSSSTSSTSSSSNSTNTTSTTGSTVLVIGNFSNLYIKAAVNEVDIPNIKTGQKATITLDAFPDKTFVGTVASVDSIGTSTSGVVTYNAYITLQNHLFLLSC